MELRTESLNMESLWESCGELGSLPEELESDWYLWVDTLRTWTVPCLGLPPAIPGLIKSINSCLSVSWGNAAEFIRSVPFCFAAPACTASFPAEALLFVSALLKSSETLLPRAAVPAIKIHPINVEKIWKYMSMTFKSVYDPKRKKARFNTKSESYDARSFLMFAK